jgi:hypothetical protein
MITYSYWALVLGLVFGVIYLFGFRWKKWGGSLATGLIVLIIGWGAYVLHFQNLFVKRWGGVMTVTVPDGHMHLSATWKDDNLWVENYDPEKNECTFSEYSKGNMLQGKVTFKNCNPVLPGSQQP